MKPYGCANRAPPLPVALVQDGWTQDQRRNMVLVDVPMAKDCNFTGTKLGQADPRCQGCKWRKQ